MSCAGRSGGAAAPHQASRHRGVQGGAPLVHVANGDASASRIDVLEQVPRGTGGGGGEDLRVVREARQHDDANARHGVEEPADRTDAVTGRHHEVEEHHVGPRSGGFGHRLGRAARLADHLDAVLQAEERTESLAHDRVVVDDQDADRWAHAVTSAGR